MPTSFPTSGTPATTTSSTVRFPQATVTIPMHFTELANSQVLKIAVPYRFRVDGVLFRNGAVSTSSGNNGAATLTARINGTAITTQPASATIGLTHANTQTVGATVALSSSATIATGIDVTSNIGTAGQTVEIAISSVTAFTAGSGWVEFTISNIESVQ